MDCVDCGYVLDRGKPTPLCPAWKSGRHRWSEAEVRPPADRVSDAAPADDSAEFFEGTLADGLPAEPPVAAPDHADATPRPWAVDPAFPCQFGGDLQGSEGEWGMCVGETEDAEDAALIVQAVNERDAFLAERQQDKERIERLERLLAAAVGAFEELRAVRAGEKDTTP